MIIVRNKSVSILFLQICLFYTLNSYSQAYEVNKKEAGSKDLAYYDVISNEFEYKVYFDSFNEKAAFEAIPYLHEVYKEILKFNIVKCNLIKWADVCFVSDENYKSPALGNTRWLIQNENHTDLSHQAKDKIYSILAHEQVHALQSQFENCKNLPRWFEEGQAVWTESKILSHLTPKKWSKRFENLKKANKSKRLNGIMTSLESWGGMGFSIEAIKKQLTPEGVKYLEEHGETPPGVTLSFEPTDFKEKKNDIFSHAAYYYKSYIIFKVIEDDIGTKELITWSKHILSKCYDTNEIINSLKERYGLDISEKLK